LKHTGCSAMAGTLETETKTKPNEIPSVKYTHTTLSLPYTVYYLSLDPAEEYKMCNKRSGLALIFNQEKFFGRLGLNDRVDRYNLKERLKDLNFEVRCYDNYKQVDVLDEIAKAAEADHSDADCFLLAFLSHREDNHVYCYDGKISIQDMMSMFKGDNCGDITQLMPMSIFNLQACRGKLFDEGVTVTPADAVFADASAIRTLPAGADFIICSSVAEGESSGIRLNLQLRGEVKKIYLIFHNHTRPPAMFCCFCHLIGYYSFRETKKGSWYIQALCEMLRKYDNSLEFTELLTLVNRKVSMRNVPKSCDTQLVGKKQMPCFASMLTKKLYF
uniref:Caspase-6 n=1 Tax=Neolamprologus brichardi TaxID=32507 RepID=A0A3Q4H7Q6_NEOBR